VVYSATITTEAATVEEAPLVTNVKVTKGVLYRFEIYFPPGPSGLVGVQIRYHDQQLYPVQRNEWFIGDNVTIGFDDLYGVDTTPFIFEIRTYNVDTDYDHLVQLRMAIVSQDEYMAKSGAFSDIDKLAQLLIDIEDRTKAANSMSVEDAREVVRGN